MEKGTRVEDVAESTGLSVQELKVIERRRQLVWPE